MFTVREIKIQSEEKYYWSNCVKNWEWLINSDFSSKIGMLKSSRVAIFILKEEMVIHLISKLEPNKLYTIFREHKVQDEDNSVRVCEIQYTVQMLHVTEENEHYNIIYKPIDNRYGGIRKETVLKNGSNNEIVFMLEV